MAGVLFIVCIPHRDHEDTLKKKERVKTTVITTNDQTSSHRLIDELKENHFFGHMRNAVDSVPLHDGAIKSKSIECISPQRNENPQESEIKLDLFKSKSEAVLAPEKMVNGCVRSCQEVKRAMSPNRDKLRITIPEMRERPADLFISEASMESILKEVLERLHVKDAAWCPGKENKYYQVFFSLETGPLSDEAILLLGSFGIGTRYNSVVSVIPCALYYHADALETNTTNQALNDGNMLHEDDTGGRGGGGGAASGWSRFVSSRARSTLAQVVNDVRADAALSFDWLFLLIVAAFVSAIGLVENSSIFLVASMLISPLMGPIMAGTVGTALSDRSLQRMGVLHELYGLLMSCVIGFLFGLVICAVDERYGVGDWPTVEMMSRCEVRSLWLGVMVALPSGAGVALAVLGGYTASLVGVAISASLLPPAVNAGLLWAMSLIHLVYLEDESRWTNVVTTSLYSKNPATELAVHGMVSLCLTLVNIICIFVGGVIVYKIKEVAPIDPSNMTFWRAEGNTGAPAQKDAECARAARESGHSRSTVDVTAWDYFRWSSMTERLRLARRAAGSSHHDTWSPFTHAPPGPSAQDIETFCRHQTNRDATGSFPNHTSGRPASQGYASLTLNTSLTSVAEDDGREGRANAIVDQRPPFQRSVSTDGSKRFRVTPTFEMKEEK